jgi:hypothetical protein
MKSTDENDGMPILCIQFSANSNLFSLLTQLHIKLLKLDLPEK